MNQLNRGNIISNTVWMLLGSITRLLVQLVIGAITARYLGPHDYGVLSYVGAYISFFSILCELGLTITIVNEIVNNPLDQGKTVGTAIVLRIVASVLSTLLLVLLSAIIDGNNEMIIRVALLRAFGLFFDSFSTITFWFQSKLQSKYVVTYELVAYIITSVYKIVIIICQKNIYWFAVALSLDSALVAIFLLVGYGKHSEYKLGFEKKRCYHLIKQGIPFVLSGVMVFVYGQTDRIMIGKMLSQEDVGLYTCAATIGTMIAFIAQAIINTSKPVIMEQKNINKDLYESRIRQTIFFIIWIMNLYAIIILFGGKMLIWLLYGKDFFAADSALKVLVWSYGLAYVGTVRNIWLICENKKRYATVFSTFGAVANICLNLFMIPAWGIVGASIATLTTQIITSFLAPLMFKQTRDFSLLLLDGLLARNIKMEETVEMITEYFNRLKKIR